MGVSSQNSSSKQKKMDPTGYDASTSFIDPRISTELYQEGRVLHNVKLEELPNFAELKSEVEKFVDRMSWWESYGIDTCIHVFGCVGAVASFFFMRSESIPVFAFGVFLLGCCHSILALKGGHLATHGAVCRSRPLNRLQSFFFSDVCGTFPSDSSHTIHVKEHHAYTNIIGIGDSSTWKVPIVPAYLYMFVTPFLIPVITPFVAIITVWGQWFSLLRFLVLASLGLLINFMLFMKVSGFGFPGAVLMTLLCRGVLSVPYIHVNIFQHIGLPMFTREKLPKKLYQMSTGVLNLSRNAVLDYCFGHSIISCHIEHHLFPRLSDQQCLAVKTLVRRFLKENGMAYNEATYTDRLMVFLRRYKQLMVNAPPISHFVGIQ
ncbi:hypothetical protein BaRGS_00000013 [Batillaria attramentaria]|uniref:Fatty acid desaturase domain-containing protein n=1 Tax=Batillaria attramentaria TaxID=370345 RepID=A0ABD0MA44_9CAEN